MREQNFWSEILKMYYFTSLYLGPVWPNGYLFFNILNLAIWNMGCPKTQEFCHSRFKILPNTLNKTSTIGQRFSIFLFLIIPSPTLMAFTRGSPMLMDPHPNQQQRAGLQYAVWCRWQVSVSLGNSWMAVWKSVTAATRARSYKDIFRVKLCYSRF